MLRPTCAAVRLALLATLALPGALSAQAQDITGRVVDAESGAGIGGATVQVQNTRRATVTNDDGGFVLRVDRFPATLVVRRISYGTARQRVAQPGTVDVTLERADLALDAFEVTGEDPAIRLMRRVIEARRRRTATLAAYNAEAYTRYVIRNDTGIVALTESESSVYWRRTGGLREIVRARRQTDNLPLRRVLPAADNVLDLSAEEISLAGFRFVGLTHADALDAYRFRITGQRVLDGQRVYDLDVAPRDPLTVAFSGTIAVLDSAAAIVEADLRPGPAFRFPAPIRRYEARLRQTFGEFGGLWLPVGYRANTDVEVGMAGVLAFPPFRIEQITRLSDYRVGEAGPDSLFARRTAAVADTAAQRRTPARGVPLTRDEQAAYATVDSSDSIQQAFKPTGPLARFVRMNVRAGDDTLASAGGRAGRLRLDRSPRLWFNRVEGAHLGLALGLSGRRGGVALEGGYETATKRAAYDARLKLGPARRRVELAYGVATVPTFTSYLQTRALNSVGVLLGNGDAFDYTRRRRAELGVTTERRRWNGAVLLRAEHHEAPAVATDFVLTGRAETRSNVLFAPLDLRTVEGRLGVGEVPVLGVVGGNALRAEVEQGLGVAGGDAAFTRVAVVLDRRFETLARRRPFPATLDVRVVGQVMGGEAVPVRYGQVERARSLATPFGSLRTVRSGVGRAPLAGPVYGAVFAEHNFRTLVWERLGLTALADRGYSLLLTGAAAAIADAPLGDSPRWTTPLEAGVSVSGLFGLFRLDASARLDQRGFTLGISPARLF